MNILPPSNKTLGIVNSIVRVCAQMRKCVVSNLNLCEYEKISVFVDVKTATALK